jgi:AcrR family transcriptional regulator
MNGYERRSRTKREAIIGAAEALFAEKGISATNITEIAARAGVSRVTLFKYFGDKEALCREVLKSWIEQLMAEYKAVLDRDMPFGEKLLALLQTKLTGWDRIGDRYINAAVWDDPEIKRLISELAAEKGRQRVLQFIGQGKASGFIDASLDNDAILVYFSAFRPVVENTEYIKKGKAFQTSLFNLFLGGLVKNWYEISDGQLQNKEQTKSSLRD